MQLRTAAALVPCTAALQSALGGFRSDTPDDNFTLSGDPEEPQEGKEEGSAVDECLSEVRAAVRAFEGEVEAALKGLHGMHADAEAGRVDGGAVSAGLKSLRGRLLGACDELRGAFREQGVVVED